MYWDTVGVKRRLLRWTLRYARKCIPFYRDYFESIPLDVPQLSDFPVVDKSMLASDLNRFMNMEQFPDFALTSGGTSGTLTFIPGSFAELEMAYKFETGICPGEYLDPAEISGITIHLIGLDHGSLPDAPHGQPLLKLPFTSENHVAMVLHLLEEGMIVGGRRFPVLCIMGTLIKVRRLTAYLLESGFDMKSSPVRFIIVYSSHLSSIWRERLAGFWGAEVLNRYGLSEFFYDVPAECAECGAFHFKKTHAEVATAQRSCGVDGGDGFLVLTSLVPFARLLPRIRYWTDDIVRVHPPCETAGGEHGLEFLGRAAGCVLIPSQRSLRALITSSEIVEALETIPETWCDDSDGGRSGFFRDRNRKFEVPFQTSSPVYRLMADARAGEVPSTIEVLVEALTTPGSRNPGLLRDEIHRALCSTSPRFFDDAKSLGIDVRIEVLPPSGLAERGLEPQFTF